MEASATKRQHAATLRNIKIINIACNEEDIEQRKGAGKHKTGTIVGTLSFPVNSEKIRKRKELRDNSAIIAAILKRRKPDLLLCAGWSIPIQARKFVEDATRKLGTIVILETIDKDGGREYWKIKRGRTSCMGSQKFGKRKDVDTKVLHQLYDESASRSFRFSGKNVFLLICGEVMVVKGRNDVCFDDHCEKLTKTLTEKNVIILNPTHTRMANDGAIKAWRKFLSKAQQLYLSASNWDVGGKKKQKPSPTLHSMWYDSVC
ncbi:MAG TPA: hypothetical protein VFK06_15515 [Candidatus Angelobacter sp.]|nr:hypothetical protein [Candidatus Angelobacter sp.]